MPTDIYTQPIDDTETPLRIEWQVEWDMVQCWQTEGGSFNPKPRNIPVVTSIEHHRYLVELTKDCWHRVSPAPEEFPEGHGGSMRTAEDFYRAKLDMELVQAFCQECFDKNPKLYTEAA